MWSWDTPPVGPWEPTLGTSKIGGNFEFPQKICSFLVGQLCNWMWGFFSATPKRFLPTKNSQNTSISRFDQDFVWKTRFKIHILAKHVRRSKCHHPNPHHCDRFGNRKHVALLGDEITSNLTLPWQGNCTYQQMVLPRFCSIWHAYNMVLFLSVGAQHDALKEKQRFKSCLYANYTYIYIHIYAYNHI